MEMGGGMAGRKVRQAGKGERRDGDCRRQDRGFHVAFSMCCSRRASGCAWRYAAGGIALPRAGRSLGELRCAVHGGTIQTLGSWAEASGQQLETRHKSVEMLRVYCRDAELFAGNAAAGLL
jgi:hypothetical protein